MNNADLVAVKTHKFGAIYVKEMSPIKTGGPKTPLVFVHGAMHGAWCWDSWMPLLAAAGWRCFALSLRNHPGSDQLPNDEYLKLIADDYVRDITAVVDEMEQPPVLIGHSMGSILAQKAAEVSNIAGLVMMCGAGPGQLGKLREPIPLTGGVLREPNDLKSVFFNEISDDAFLDYYRQLVPESPSVINMCNDGTLMVDSAKIRCPALVIAGGADQIKMHLPHSTANYYDADLLMVPGGSHVFFLESPALPVAIRLNEWLLKSVDGPAFSVPV